jgi:hypothetical protein
MDAVIALAALGHDPRLPAPSGLTAAHYLSSQATAVVGQGAMPTGRLMVAAKALGMNPRSFGGLDLAQIIYRSFNPSTGAFGQGTIGDNAWAILGLSAAGLAIPEPAVDYLLDARVPEGGWGSGVGADEDNPTDTGLVLQALAVSGVDPDHPAVWQGIETLRRRQRSNGRFPGLVRDTDAIATARAIGGLLAYDHRVGGLGWAASRQNELGRNGPMDALLAMQSRDGGFSGLTGPNDPTATYVAALALAMAPLPVEPARSGRTTFLPMLVNF